MNPLKIIFIIIFFAAIPFSPVQADVFSWIDEDGVRYFSNVKHPDSAGQLVVSEEIEYRKPTDDSKNAKKANAGVAAAGSEQESRESEPRIYYVEAAAYERDENDTDSKENSANRNSEWASSYISEKYEEGVSISETFRPVYPTFGINSSSLGILGYGRDAYRPYRHGYRGRFGGFDRHSDDFFGHYNNYRHRKNFGTYYFRHPGKKYHYEYRFKRKHGIYPNHRVYRQFGSDKFRRHPGRDFRKHYSGHGLHFGSEHGKFKFFRSW